MLLSSYKELTYRDLNEVFFDNSRYYTFIEPKGVRAFAIFEDEIRFETESKIKLKSIPNTSSVRNSIFECYYDWPKVVIHDILESGGNDTKCLSQIERNIILDNVVKNIGLQNIIKVRSIKYNKDTVKILMSNHPVLVSKKLTDVYTTTQQNWVRFSSLKRLNVFVCEYDDNTVDLAIIGTDSRPLEVATVDREKIKKYFRKDAILFGKVFEISYTDITRNKLLNPRILRFCHELTVAGCLAEL